MTGSEDRADRGHERDEGDSRRHDHEIGSVGEEAAKLLGALGDWAKDQGHGYADVAAAGAASAGEALREVDRHLATGAAECRYCPICVLVAKVRATPPEVRQHLSSASTSLLAAVAGMLATPVPEDAGRRGPVERIDLDDDRPAPEPTPEPGAATGRQGAPADTGPERPWWASDGPDLPGGSADRPEARSESLSEALSEELQGERRVRRTRRACTDEGEEPR